VPAKKNLVEKLHIAGQKTNLPRLIAWILRAFLQRLLEKLMGK
jgi:hypothetical protein